MVGLRLPPPVVVLGLSLASSFYSLHLARASADGRLIGLLSIAILAIAILTSASAITAISTEVRWIRSLGRTLFSVSAGLVLALALSAHSLPQLAPGQELSHISRIEGRLSEDVSLLEGGRALLRLDISGAVSAQGIRTSARGPVLVFCSREALQGSRLVRGSVVSVEGVFREGTQGPCFSGKRIALLEEASGIEPLRASIRGAFLERFSVPRWGALAAALLIGSKDLLENGESKSYTAAGVAHVLALSGMHLALFSLLLSFLLRRPLGLRLAAVVSLILIAFYVYLAGAQASLLRALFMYGLGVVAILGGFPAGILPILSASFVLQLIWDPVSATGLSFILSYLALLGLVLPGACLDEMGEGLFPEVVRAPVAASIAAFLSTALVSVAVFGCLRPIGLLVGLVLAPAANILMLGALLWFCLGLIHPALATPVSWLLDLIYDLNFRVVTWGAEVPPLMISSLWGVSFLTLAGLSLIVYGRSHIRVMRKRVEPVD